MLTFLPMEEVDRLSALEGAEINKAKEILAYEVTKLVHGEEEARKALDGARAAFAGGGDMANIPTVQMARAPVLKARAMGIVNLIKELGLVPSNSEGFRTIEQGGLSINGSKVTDKKMNITLDNFEDGKLLIQKGKKKFQMIELI